MNACPLKLRACDEDDLKTISACLQDAIAPTADMTYRAADHRFVMVVNRFCWECELPQRVNAGMTVEGVRKVQKRNFPTDAADPRYLELLALLSTPCDDGDGAVLELVFSGGPAVRLLCDRIDLRLEDIDQPWPAQTTPRHPAQTTPPRPDGMETKP